MSDGFYLRTRYEDPRRGEVRIREYADDGSVWAVVNGERTLWSRFDAGAVEAAKQAVLARAWAACRTSNDKDTTWRR